MNNQNINQKTISSSKGLVPLFGKIDAEHKGLVPLFGKIQNEPQSIGRLFERIEPQQKVLTPLFEKIAEPATTDVYAIAPNALPEVLPMPISQVTSIVDEQCNEQNEKEDTKIEIVTKKKQVVPAMNQKQDFDIDIVESYGNFAIRLINRIVEIDHRQDGDVCISYYYFSIIVNNGEKYFAKVAGRSLYNLSWIGECSGGAAYISTDVDARQNIVKQLHQMIDLGGYCTYHKFLQNGWKKLDGKWKFVIDSGVVGENQDVIMGDATHPFIYDAEYVGHKSVFLDALGMLNICADQTITLPLFLFTHLGVLGKLFEIAKVPVKGVLAVVGLTNSRKTSMALCMTKSFCRDNIFTPEISFESTQGGIEVESSRHADSVLLIDDFHPAITKKNQNKMLELLEFILRRYGDRTVKKRMTDFLPNKSIGKYGVEGVCIITGEDIAGVQSSMTRVLVVEVNRDSVNNDFLSYYQKNPMLLTTHLYDFIAYVTEKFDDIVKKILQSVGTYRKQVNYDVPRFNEYFAQFLVCSEIISDYAVERKFWNKEEALRWNTECVQKINILIQKNLVNVEREDFATMIVQALNSVLEDQGAIKLDDLNTKILSNCEIAMDNEYFYLKVDYMMEITRRYWAKFGKELPFASKKQMTMFLEQKKLILVKKEGDDIRRTLPIPQGKQRVLYIKREAMAKLLDTVHI